MPITQQQNMEAMRKQVKALGGTITTYEELPPHIEEEFLRQALDHPDKGLLKRNELGITDLRARIKAAIDSTKPRQTSVTQHS